MWDWVQLQILHSSVANTATIWLDCLAQNLDHSQCPNSQGHIISFGAFFAQQVIALLIPTVFALVLLSDPDFANHWIDSFKRHVLRQNVPDRFQERLRAEAMISSSSKIRQSGDSGTSTGFETIASDES